jgi:hypothetical protein
MSSSTDENGKRDDHAAYAPKWERDSSRETSQESPSIGDNATCAMIVAEIEANNIKVRELAGEEGGRSPKTSSLAWPEYSSRCCGSEWISKARQAKR